MVSKKVILGGGAVILLLMVVIFSGGGENVPDEEVPEIPVNLYTASEDNTVHHLDMNGSQLWSYDEHGDAVTSVAVAGDGSILTSALDGSHRIAADGSQQQVIRQGGWINDVAVDDTGIYLADDGGIVYKHDGDGNELWAYEEHSDSAQGLAVHNGNVYSAGRGGAVHKISADGDQLWAYEEHASVFDVAADSNGDIYTAANNGVHKVSADGDQLWTYEGHGGPNVGGVTVHNGKVYTVGDSGELHVLDAENGDHLWTYSQGVWINDVAVDDAGYVYTAADNGQVHKIDPRGDQVWSYTEHSGSVQGIAVVTAG